MMRRGTIRYSKVFGPGKNLPHIWLKANQRRNRRKDDLSQVLADDDDFYFPETESSTPQPRSEEEMEEDKVETVKTPSLDYHTSGSDHSYYSNKDDTTFDFPLAIEEVEVETEEISPANQEVEVVESNAITKPPVPMDTSDCQSLSSQTTSDSINKCKFTSYETYNLWRHGPAEYWYDMIGLPSDEPTHFDYGFKLKEPFDFEFDFDQESTDDDEDEKQLPALCTSKPKKHPFPDECFEMVTQLHWEDDIILDKDDPDFKERILKSKFQTWEQVNPGRNPWTIAARQNYNSLSGPISQKSQFNTITSKLHHRDGDTWHSIFPVDSEDLVKYPWEKDIIWDPMKMDEIPVPKILELDPNDENIVICPPEDSVPQKSLPVKTKILLPHFQKSKILLGKAGLIKIVKEYEPEPGTVSKSDDKDPYNISNDEFYQPKRTNRSNLKLVGNLNNIQHPIPVLELRQPYIPTHLNPSKLLTLNRPALRVYKSGSNEYPGPHAVFSLTKRIEKKAKLREEASLNVGTGAGNEFLIRMAEDLSGKDGEILLIEYAEQYPPLLSMIGMASKIKNYYKRKADKDNEPTGKYGETVISHTSPFLGIMHPGQLIQTIENNLYRAPIFQHELKLTDFLILRTRNNFYIRTFDAMFTAAQECPLYEVPRPNSKKNTEFIRDSMLVYIYRLFWDSTDTPRKIRMEDVKKAFPAFSEAVIRKKLKMCSDFFRTGPDQHLWVLRPEFRLPTEEELRQLITPEHYCAYFSMLAAEQRLCSAGYVNQYLPGDREDDDNDYKVDDEVKNAPWNTTRAFVQAMKGKCIMQVDGAADPTGCGEGFSYIRIPNKPTNTEDKDSQNKKLLSGTEADLRKLSLPKAKALLRKFNVPETEIQTLSRWEVIDVVRTLSTEKAKAEGGTDLKFSRLKSMSTAEHHEKYREDCQRIFDLQNQVLFSKEELSTDEDLSSEEEELETAGPGPGGEDLETLGKNIEHILMDRKTTGQIEYEKEETERLELVQMIHGESDKKKNGDNDSEINGLKLHPDRILKIQRRYKVDGREFARTEIVRNPNVIDIYMRIRTTKDEKWIRQFAETAINKKEKLIEKRRQLAQLKGANKPGRPPLNKSPAYKIKKKAENFKPNAKVKCGSCGEVGHMKSNKLCAKYKEEEGEEAPIPSVKFAMTEEQEQQLNKELKEDKEIGCVKVDGIKLRISGIVLKQADEIKRQTLILKVPKEFTNNFRKRKRLSEQQPDCDYFEGRPRSVNRRRIDPQITLTNIFTAIIDELRTDKINAPSFLNPVSSKIPNYYEIIKSPIDLRTIRSNNQKNIYKSQAEFLADMKLMVDNARTYNGDLHPITAQATKLYETAFERLTENEDKISILEKEIQQLYPNGQVRPKRLL